MPRLSIGLLGLAIAAMMAVASAPVAESAPLLKHMSSAVALLTEADRRQSETMKIRITVGDSVLAATLTDSETSRDFVSLLPLTLTLDDYARTEKISMLPRRLSTAGAAPGSDPSPGDIAIYAPWGNLAIYYEEAGYASGLITLGRIDDGLETFRVSGSLVATIERVD